MWSFPEFRSFTDIKVLGKAADGILPQVRRLQRFQNLCDVDSHASLELW